MSSTVTGIPALSSRSTSPPHRPQHSHRLRKSQVHIQASEWNAQTHQPAVAADIWVESLVSARSNSVSSVSRTSTSSRLSYQARTLAGPYSRKVRDLRSGPKEVIVRTGETKPKVERLVLEGGSFDSYRDIASSPSNSTDSWESLPVLENINPASIFAFPISEPNYTIGPYNNPTSVPETPVITTPPPSPPRRVLSPVSPTYRDILIANTRPLLKYLEQQEAEERERLSYYRWASPPSSIHSGDTEITPDHANAVYTKEGSAIFRPCWQADNTPNNFVTWENQYPVRGGGDNIFGFEEDFVRAYRGDRESYHRQINQVQESLLCFETELAQTRHSIVGNYRWYRDEDAKYRQVHGNLSLDENNQAILIAGAYLKTNERRINEIIGALKEVLLRHRILHDAEWKQDRDAGELLAKEIAERIHAKGLNAFFLPLRNCVDY